jgi:tRNA(Arg) A34 adenosine deaminase TadA
MIEKAFLIVLSVFVLSSNVISAGTVEQAPSCIEETGNSTHHEPFIRQAFELSISAGNKGNHTFGALLVYQNRVILTSENTVNTDNNVHSHAEINLMTKAKREIPPEVLRESTMYTSTAPCMLCCASMLYRNIARVVYGVSYNTFAKITGFEDKGISCDKLYQETGKTIEWIGPVLEKEGMNVFNYWPTDPFQNKILKNLEELGIAKPCNMGLGWAAPVPHTGQTKCYDVSGNVITCPPPGQPLYGQVANYIIHPMSYTKLDSSGNTLPDSDAAGCMVRDNVTGLIWEMKTKGWCQELRRSP